MFGLFFEMLPMGVLYNQALVDVRSTGAGIKCLYCTCTLVLVLGMSKRELSSFFHELHNLRSISTHSRCPANSGLGFK